MKNTKKTLLFIWDNMKKYRLHFFMTFVLFGVFILIETILIPVYIKKLTDTLSLQHIADSYSILIVIGVLTVSGRLLLFLSMHILSWFQSVFIRDLHNFSYTYFTKHSYHFYVEEFAGSLSDKLQRLGNNMVSIIDNIIFNMYSLIIAVIGIFWVLFRENITIGLIFFGFLVLYVFLTYFLAKKLAPIYVERSTAKSNFSGVISDIITNFHTILFFENRKVDVSLFKTANDIFHKKRYKAWKTYINYQDSLNFLPPLFIVGITSYAVYLTSLGSLTTGSVILIFLLSSKLNTHIRSLGEASKRFVSDISDTVESIKIIEKEVDVKDPEHPETPVMHNGVISFDTISFTYPDGDHVFDSFNLSIPAGQSVGIVGKSGSGKTTITKLLLRLYDVDAGAITIDGQNIAHVTQHDLRTRIAYIPQETILFHRTIYENIAYGNPDATREQVLAAAKAAHVDEFVQNLEQGYETQVGERGVKLSGGQRQRVGIARAMLKSDAPILILDEATSSLDSKSENYIQDSFAKLSKNRTTVVIAHRLSTIQKLDRIIVMEKGQIIEDGSHDTLLQKKGHYADLWYSQINGFVNEDSEIED